MLNVVTGRTVRPPEGVDSTVKKEGFNATNREIPGRHFWFLWRDFRAHYAQIAFGAPAKS